jgi:hypothetical protein
LEEVIEDIQDIRGRKPKLGGRDARTYPNTVSYEFLKREIEKKQDDFFSAQVMAFPQTL